MALQKPGLTNFFFFFFFWLRYRMEPAQSASAINATNTDGVNGSQFHISSHTPPPTPDLNLLIRRGGEDGTAQV